MSQFDGADKASYYEDAVGEFQRLKAYATEYFSALSALGMAQQMSQARRYWAAAVGGFSEHHYTMARQALKNLIEYGDNVYGEWSDAISRANKGSAAEKTRGYSRAMSSFFDGLNNVVEEMDSAMNDILGDDDHETED